MLNKSEIIRKVIKKYKETEMIKTNDCPSEDTVWDLVQGILSKKNKKQLLSHIHDCAYCLQLYTDVKFYLNPPEIEIPDEVSQRVHRAIEAVVFQKPMIQVAFKYVQEQSKFIIDKVRQLTEKGIREIHFEPILIFAKGGEEGKAMANDYTFSTDEAEISVYPKGRDLTMTIDEGPKYSSKREIDDLEVILVVEGCEPRRQKPQNGIVKYENLEDKPFKIFVE